MDEKIYTGQNFIKDRDGRLFFMKPLSFYSKIYLINNKKYHINRPDERIHHIIRNVCIYFNTNLLDETWYLYKKLIPWNKVVNAFTAYYVIVSESRYNITIKQIVEYASIFHKISNRLIIDCIFRNNLKIKKKSLAALIEIYKFQVFYSDIFRKKMIKRKIDEKKALEILHKPIRFKKIQSKYRVLAAAIIYAKCRKNKLLTMKDTSRITGIPINSIRDNYIRYISDYYEKN